MEMTYRDFADCYKEQEGIAKLAATVTRQHLSVANRASWFALGDIIVIGYFVLPRL
jgi:hypothetical protein